MKTGLYVHIPFCKSKCRYCDFNSYAKMDEYKTPYFSALLKEASHYSPDTSPVDTVYFGGGTPTSIDPRLLADTLGKFFDIFTICDGAEITAECNPGTIDFEGLKILRQGGINRLSIGLQSTDDSCLKTLGRIHTYADFKKCFEDARRAGFDNISVDLMYGLPDMTLDDFRKTLAEAISFNMEHISAYALKIEEGTPFSEMNLNLPDEDTVADMYELAIANLTAAGYQRYEISNFAKKGKESRHNLKYWRCEDFLGLGAGAYSCIRGRRFSNETEISKYIQAVNSKGMAEVWSKTQERKEQMSEFMFLGLRCSDGVLDTDFRSRFGCSFMEEFGEAIKKYAGWNFLVFDGDRLTFSDKGFFVSNAILADFV